WPDDMLRPLRSSRNGVAVLLVLLTGDSVADGRDLLCNGVQSEERTRERLRAQNVIRVKVSEIEALDGLTQRGCVGGHLVSIGQHVLCIDDNKRLLCFHDVAVDAPPLFGSRIGVNADLAAPCQSDFAEHDGLLAVPVAVRSWMSFGQHCGQPTMKAL